MLPLRVRVELSVIVIEGYSTFHKAPGLEPHYQMQFSVISRTLVGGGEFYHTESLQSACFTALDNWAEYTVVWFQVFLSNTNKLYTIIWFQVINHHHHHHVVPPARISQTLFRHFFLLFIASGKSSGLHPVSSHSCCMYVRAGRHALARPYVGVYWSTSLMSSSLLLQQCPVCLVRLTWIVFVMGGRWLYSWCFVGCCLQDLFNIARNILV